MTLATAQLGASGTNLPTTTHKRKEFRLGRKNTCCVTTSAWNQPHTLTTPQQQPPVRTGIQIALDYNRAGQEYSSLQPDTCYGLASHHQHSVSHTTVCTVETAQHSHMPWLSTYQCYVKWLSQRIKNTWVFGCTVHERPVNTQWQSCTVCAVPLLLLKHIKPQCRYDDNAGEMLRFIRTDVERVYQCWRTRNPCCCIQ